MRRTLLLLLGAAGLLAVAGLALAVPWVVDLPRVHALLQFEASRILDRPVRFERLALQYWPLPALKIHRLVVANPTGFGPEPLVSVEAARVRVRPLALLRGRLQLGEITLARPRVVVEQRRDGAWNLPAPGRSQPAPAAPLVLVSRVRLSDGQVEFRIPGEAGRPVAAHVVDHIDVALDDLGWSDPIRIHVAARLLGGGVTLTADGHVGPLAAAGADLAGIPVRLAARFLVQEARVPGETGLAITGTGKGELRAEGPLGQLVGGGHLSFARLTLRRSAAACGPRGSRPLALEAVALPVRIAGSTLTVEPFGFRMSGGEVHGNAVLGFQGATPSVRLTDLRLEHVSAESLLVDFLCQPYAIAGPLDASGELSFAGTGEELRRSARGTWQLRAGPGRLVGPAMLGLLSRVVQAGIALYSVVNLDVPLALFASPLDFDSLTATGLVGDDRLSMRESRLHSRHVRVTGQGAYGLSDTRLDFLFNVETGRTAYAVRVGGTAAQPTYTPSTRGLFRGLADALAPLLGSRKGLAAPRSGTGAAPR